MQQTLAPRANGHLTEVTAMLGVAVTAEGHDHVRLTGRLHAGCLADVRLTFLRVVSSGTGPVHLDLGSAELGDAAAVGLLLEAHHLALRSGRRLVVDRATPRSVRLLRAVRMLPRGWRGAAEPDVAVEVAPGGPAGVAALTA